jgi:hypothetical protein
VGYEVECEETRLSQFSQTSKDGDMRIADTEHDRALHHIGLGLTEAEASELRQALDALLVDPGARLEHVSSSDYQCELTVWLDRD